MSLKNETKASLELDESIAVLRFEGDITSTSKDAVLGKYNSVPDKIQCVLLDLARVGYLNSSGIALIIQLLMDASRRSRKVRVFGLSPHFQKVFMMLGLATYMNIDPDEVTARRAVQA